MRKNYHTEDNYEKLDKKKHVFALIRHPSSDNELEKFPINEIQDLAMQCYSIIEQPTENLAQMFKIAYSFHHYDRTWWIQCYKLARFEKMIELERNGEI